MSIMFLATVLEWRSTVQGGAGPAVLEPPRLIPLCMPGNKATLGRISTQMLVADTPIWE